MALATPEIELRGPAVRCVSERGTTRSAPAHKIEAIILIRRPGEFVQLLPSLYADFMNRIDECNGHINYVRTGLSNDAARQAVCPMVGLGRNVINGGRKKNAHASKFSYHALFR